MIQQRVVRIETFLKLKFKIYAASFFVVACVLENQIDIYKLFITVVIYRI